MQYLYVYVPYLSPAYNYYLLPIFVLPTTLRIFLNKCFVFFRDILLVHPLSCLTVPLPFPLSCPLCSSLFPPSSCHNRPPRRVRDPETNSIERFTKRKYFLKQATVQVMRYLIPNLGRFHIHHFWMFCSYK